MSEEKEGPESGPEGMGSGLGPAAIALALNSGSCDPGMGEALVYAGKKDEVKKKFARAAQLDLTPSEKSELVRHP